VIVPSRPAGIGRHPASGGDYELPHGDLDSILVAALERLALALDLLLRRTAREHDLKPLQVRLLVLLWHDGETRRRLRELARACGAETAAARTALADLESRGLVERPAEERDRRTVRLILTPVGRSLALAMSGWAGPVRGAVARTPAGPKEALVPVLVDWVEALHRARVLTVARVCPTCRFFARDVQGDSRAPHYCRLFEEALASSDLRVDCPEHQRL
jgi:DNA-binding MarR family transcriptional regulator